MKTSTLIKYLFPHQNSFNLKQIDIYNWRYISYFVLWHCRSIKYVLHKGRVVGCHRASKSLFLSLTVPLTLFSSVQPVPPLTVGVQFRTWNLMVVYKSFEENSILTDSLGTGMTDRRWGEDFLSRQPDFFTETAVTSERKIVSKVGN